MSTGFLHSDPDLTTFILDIPASISDSQGGGRVFSVAALEEPYITPEPRGQKRLEFISRFVPEDVTYHQEIQTFVRDALQRMRPEQRWCHPRVETSFGFDAHALCPAESSYLPVVLSPLPNRFHAHSEVQHCVVSNDGLKTSLVITATRYVIPSQCRFIWSSIEQSRGILDDLPEKPCFDIVLLDPPWPNRSVKNAKTYTTMHRGNVDVFQEAMSIAREYSSHSGHIAIWITNKHAIRCQVLEHMIMQGFQLAEEWVWLKVTSKGEPVTILDGIWRRPYEVLLIFRRSEVLLNMRRRLIGAVPDIHSRKPNLKYLFDTIFGPGLTLELFARNLTSGWWSIGNEVLKFQDHRAWLQPPE